MSQQFDESNVRRLANRLKEFFNSGEIGADTLDGVSSRYMDVTGLNEQVTVLSAALDRLVEQGFLDVRELPGGDVLYIPECLRN